MVPGVAPAAPAPPKAIPDFTVQDPAADASSTAAEENPTSSDDVRDPVKDLTDLYGHLSVAEDGRLRYFGAPSYFNLLHHHQYDAVDTSAASLPSMYNNLPPSWPQIPIELRDHLLALYWTWQNPWQYLVHEQFFRRDLQEMNPSGYVTPLLLYSVLALASRYSDRIEVRSDKEDPNSAGEIFAEHAKLLLQTEIHHPVTSTVVAALLLGLREMAVNKEASGWTYTGVAIRIAYNLGLHLNCDMWIKSHQLSEEEAEIRRIAWWACYLIDKLFSLGLGRPGIIQERDIAAREPTLLPEVELSPWKDLDSTSSTLTPMSRSVSNLRHTCRMFRITCNTLDEIYAPNSSLNLTEKENLATQTYLKVVTFYNNLPSFLKLPTSIKTALPPHIYSFHLQYHVISILLHRPFLRRRSPTTPLSELLSTNDYSHNNTCTASAEAISNIVRAYRNHYTLRRIPISTVHAVGTGSIIHLFNATSNDMLVRRTAIRLLRFNISCLEEMSTAWSWSRRAILALQLLAEEWAISESSSQEKHQEASSVHTEIPAAPAITSEICVPTVASGSEDFSFSTTDDINWLLQYDAGLDSASFGGATDFNQDLFGMRFDEILPMYNQEDM
ncbi:hypothetical protein BP6252_10722 [Coleophoma cylindrospora]|uniref:Xylanolytic transcriptional activator regulatory domain-containing protein n=1 Tax=Coleophoma cylindrospora TaxID=1849047 RepID=A0A3D8QTQ6_9HELO|nr:hypothetical protein BP6252_10722 [Coleophoma cylindrospora]